jgi:hypothetical protein
MDSSPEPVAIGSQPPASLGSRASITLQASDYDGPTMVIMTSLGLRLRAVSRVVHGYLGSAILPSDTIQILEDGMIVNLNDRVESGARRLQYRVAGESRVEPESASGQLVPTLAEVEVNQRLEPTSLVPRSLEGDTNIARLRDSYARENGISDPNTILLHLEEGLRVGSLEGNHWLVRYVRKWRCETISATVCAAYISLHGHGREFLYHSTLAASRGVSGVSVGKLRRWLVGAVLRNISPAERSRSAAVAGDVALYVNQMPMTCGAFIIPWATSVEFRLLPAVAEVFATEEKWLCPDFVCGVCRESQGAEDRPLRVTSACDHKTNICRPCIQSWMSACIDRDGWNKARCPTCFSPMEYGDVKACASAATFERYGSSEYPT